MKLILKLSVMIALGLFASACSDTGSDHGTHNGHGEAGEVEVIKGPHGGRLLVDNDFTLELSIFETGVPPEFRAWATLDGEPLAPSDVELNIKLSRLGGKVDDINFAPLGDQRGDALRGDMVIYEPHSFVVIIKARHNGVEHVWQYDNFEGRSTIEAKVAEALGIKTEIAGPVVLQPAIPVFGRIIPDTDAFSELSARFPGVIKSVKVMPGERVRKGQVLATIESNESLSLFRITSPISGVISQHHAHVGELTGTRPLFTVIDPARVLAELSLFPADRQQVSVGASVTVINPVTGAEVKGSIVSINAMSEANQSVKALVELEKSNGEFVAGSHISAQVKVAEYPVELAVKRTGLQAFRDFTVVYAKFGDQYEVRMLELGRKDRQWVEVLGGLEPGTSYVSENSYVIKADIEKSGAAHDH